MIATRPAIVWKMPIRRRMQAAKVIPPTAHPETGWPLVFGSYAMARSSVLGTGSAHRFAAGWLNPAPQGGDDAPRRRGDVRETFARAKAGEPKKPADCSEI